VTFEFPDSYVAISIELIADRPPELRSRKHCNVRAANSRQFALSHRSMHNPINKDFHIALRRCGAGKFDRLVVRISGRIMRALGDGPHSLLMTRSVPTIGNHITLRNLMSSLNLVCEAG
jgi:hypothetical protein